MRAGSGSIRDGILRWRLTAGEGNSSTNCFMKGIASSAARNALTPGSERAIITLARCKWYYQTCLAARQKIKSRCPTFGLKHIRNRSYPYPVFRQRAAVWPQKPDSNFSFLRSLPYRQEHNRLALLDLIRPGPADDLLVFCFESILLRKSL